MAELGNADKPAAVEIEVEPDAAGVPLVRVSGDLDVSNIDALNTVLARITAGRPERVVFDLSALRFIDSAGIAVLLDTAKKVPAVSLRRPSPAVRRVVELTGVSSMMSVEP